MRSASTKFTRIEGSQIKTIDNESDFLNYWILQDNEAKQIKIIQSMPEHTASLHQHNGGEAEDGAR